MTKAFCPGHITCFFSPVITDNALTTGSVGAGIRLNKGTFVTVEERGDRKVRITMDGKEFGAKVTAGTIGMMAPERGFDVTVENELPVSQGMGMSAAGAVAAGLCVSEIIGTKEEDAYRAAHVSEVGNGGGLGDVAGITGGCAPIRVKAGIPPYGRVVDAGIRMNVTVAVLGPKTDTGGVLSDPVKMEWISSAGGGYVGEFLNSQTEKTLYALSSRFSESAQLRTPDVTEAMSLLGKVHGASMCMLGNSVFTNADADTVKEILGDVETFSCSTDAEGPGIIRRA